MILEYKMNVDVGSKNGDRYTITHGLTVLNEIVVRSKTTLYLYVGNKVDKTLKRSIRNSINQHFNFLIQQGFRIGAILQTGSMGCWEATLASKDLSILLISDRGELFLAISPRNELCWIGLDVVIFYISNYETIIPDTDMNLMNDKDKQYERLAHYLNSDFDEIRCVFGKNFYNHKDELLNLRSEIEKTKINRYKNRDFIE